MKAFKVCYVSPEVTPFAETGALAHTSKGLPIALKNLNQDIRLMMPKYKSINERKYVLREVIRLREVGVELGNKSSSANGKTAFLPNSKVHVYFLSIPEYFDRKGIYNDPQSGKPYADNAERFGHFCKSVLETLKLLYWQPDIIHCTGWGAALIPYYLKSHYPDDDFFQNTRTVLTFHNPSEQGVFNLSDAAGIGIAPEEVAKGGAFELGGKLSFLKGGMTYADIISTVSQNAVNAFLTDKKSSNGLFETISTREKDLFGVLNGINYTIWDPETDIYLSEGYTIKQTAPKQATKKTLISEMELKSDAGKPTLLLVGDLSSASAAGATHALAADLLKLKLNLIVIGSGEPDQYALFEKMEEESDGKMVFRSKLDKRLTHMVTAAADMMILPDESVLSTKYYLQGLRYGTIPIVLMQGSYRDTLVNFDPESGKGNGFGLKDAKKTSIIKAVKNAINVYADSAAWKALQKNGMRLDVSWETTSAKYMKIYEKALRKK